MTAKISKIGKTEAGIEKHLKHGKCGGLELTARTTKLRRLGKEEREEKEQGTWDKEENEGEDLRRVLKEEGVDRV